VYPNRTIFGSIKPVVMVVHVILKVIVITVHSRGGTQGIVGMGDSMARKSIPQREGCFSLLELQPLHCLMLRMSTALCTINSWLIAAYNTAYVV
jgi:hypothetical protein